MTHLLFINVSNRDNISFKNVLDFTLNTINKITDQSFCSMRWKNNLGLLVWTWHKGWETKNQCNFLWWLKCQKIVERQEMMSVSVHESSLVKKFSSLQNVSLHFYYFYFILDWHCDCPACLLPIYMNALFTFPEWHSSQTRTS